jgi:hypothetical protein
LNLEELNVIDRQRRRITKGNSGNDHNEKGRNEDW